MTGRTLLGTVGTVLITLGAGGLSVGGVVAGAQMIAQSAEAVEAPPPAAATTVRTQAVTPEPGYNVTRTFVGQVEPAQQNALGFELGGRIAAVMAEEGDLVPAGRVLAQIDTAALETQRAALEAQKAALGAQAELARLSTGRREALQARGFSPTEALDQARLGLAQTLASIAALEAQIAGVDVQIGKSTLTAPFDARIGARMADPGQTIAAGQMVLNLMQSGKPHLRVGLPPTLALTLPQMHALMVEVGGTPYPARLVQIRPDLDTTTRTRSVVLELQTGAADLPLYGQTGTLRLQVAVNDPGFWAPLAALREGARGSWTVLTVGEGVVGTAAVEVIHAEAGRVFLRGSLPPATRIIATGPDRVVPGQQVREE